VRDRITKQGERINKKRSKSNLKTGLKEFKEGDVVIVCKPPYAVRIVQSIREHRNREATIVSKTAGNKFYVCWGDKGGFITRNFLIQQVFILLTQVSSHHVIVVEVKFMAMFKILRRKTTKKTQHTHHRMKKKKYRVIL